MTIFDARRFLIKIDEDDFRAQLIAVRSRSEILDLLHAYRMDFTPTELDEAYYGLLVRCQTFEAAEEIKEKKGWWDFLWESSSPTAGSQ